MAPQTRRIQQINTDNLNNLNPGQIGLSVSADSVTGKESWGGKDLDGNVNIFLEKDQNARVTGLSAATIHSTGTVDATGFTIAGIPHTHSISALDGVSTTTPLNGQVLKYVTSAGQYVPSTITVSGGSGYVPGGADRIIIADVYGTDLTDTGNFIYKNSAITMTNGSKTVNIGPLSTVDGGVGISGIAGNTVDLYFSPYSGPTNQHSAGLHLTDKSGIASAVVETAKYQMVRTDTSAGQYTSQHEWYTTSANGALAKVACLGQNLTVTKGFDTSGTYDISGTPHTHPTSAITSGVFSTARLGSGSATSATYLRGDNTWATTFVSSGANGMVQLANGVGGFTTAPTTMLNYTTSSGLTVESYAPEAMHVKYGTSVLGSQAGICHELWNVGGSSVCYAETYGEIVSNANGSESGSYVIKTRNGGTIREVARFSNDGVFTEQGSIRSITSASSSNIRINCTNNTGYAGISVFDTTVSAAFSIRRYNPGSSSTSLGFTAAETADGASIREEKGNLTIGTAGPKFIGFATNNTEVARITSAGYIGIGTDAPSYDLHIKKTTGSGEFVTASLQNITTSGGVIHYLMGGTSSIIGYIAALGVSFTPAVGSEIRDAAGVVTLVGNRSAGLNLLAQNAAGNVRVFAGGSTDAFIRMTVAAAGNVGIGTDIPGAKLHVESSATNMIFSTTTGTGNGTYSGVRVSSDPVAYIDSMQWTSATTATQFGLTRGNYNFIRSYARPLAIGCQTNDLIAFATNDTVKMTIAADGKVGVGRTPTTDILEAQGTINAITSYKCNSVQVVSTRKTGWTTDPTGTLTRTTFISDSVTLVELAKRVAALIVDLRSHGLINA